MKMPLRLAIAIGKTLRLGVYDKEFDTITKLVDHAEATRWRKLSEEKPTEEGQYLVAYVTRDDKDRVVREVAYAHWNEVRGKFRVLAPVESWAYVVGPEDES